VRADGLEWYWPGRQRCVGALERGGGLAQVRRGGGDPGEMRAGAGDDTRGLGMRVAKVMHGVQRRLCRHDGEQRDQAERECRSPAIPPRDDRQAENDEDRQKDDRCDGSGVGVNRRRRWMRMRSKCEEHDSRERRGAGEHATDAPTAPALTVGLYRRATAAGHPTLRTPASPRSSHRPLEPAGQKCSAMPPKKERGVPGVKWMSGTPLAGSPGSREVKKNCASRQSTLVRFSTVRNASKFR
jgi:hypothetical protein